MSESGGFCPSCGAAIEPDRAAVSPRPDLAGATRRRQAALCDACYFDRFDLVEAPDRFEVNTCATCGAVRQGGEWIDLDAKDYTDVAVEAIRDELGIHVDASDVAWTVEPEQVDATTIRLHATFTGIVRGTPVEESVTVPVTISKETCTRCSRIAGDYFAGIVQVRAAGRTPSGEETNRAVKVANDVVTAMEGTGDRNAFVTEVLDRPEGLDLKVSTTKIAGKIARRLVDEFGGEWSSSETLVTEDEDGNEVYRVTYAVRLPQFRPGDVIDPEDGAGPVLVRSVHGNLKGRRLATGDRYEAASEDGDAPDAAHLGHRDDAEETTLVAIEDEHAVQVLDPDTFEATTVPRPDDLDPAAETVHVMKTRTGVYVLPEG